MKKYSHFSILLILLLTALLTSCSRKYGCYYSIDYPAMHEPTTAMQPECAIESSVQVSGIGTAQ